MRISDWSSDVCSSDLPRRVGLSASRCSTLNGWRSANRRERLTVSRPFQGGIPPALSALCLWDARRGEMAVVKLITKRVEKPWGRRTLWPAFDDVMNCGEPVGEIWFQMRSEEHTSELQSLMRISYAVFCLKKKNKNDKK